MARPRREAKTPEQKEAEAQAAEDRKEVEAAAEDGPTPDAPGYGPQQADPEPDPAIAAAVQVVGADADQPLAGDAPPEKDKPKAGSGQKLATVVFDSIGYKPHKDERVMFADKGDVVALPDSEFERLEALGAVEKA